MRSHSSPHSSGCPYDYPHCEGVDIELTEERVMLIGELLQNITESELLLAIRKGYL